MKDRLGRLSLLAVAVAVLNGCAAAAAVPYFPAQAAVSHATGPETEAKIKEEDQKSAIEARSAQTKEVKAEYKMAFRSAMDVLQDLGFSIYTTDLDTGHRVAHKKIPVEISTSSLGGLITKESGES